MQATEFKSHSLVNDTNAFGQRQKCSLLSLIYTHDLYSGCDLDMVDGECDLDAAFHSRHWPLLYYPINAPLRGSHVLSARRDQRATGYVEVGAKRVPNFEEVWLIDWPTNF